MAQAGSMRVVVGLTADEYGIPQEVIIFKLGITS